MAPGSQAWMDPGHLTSKYSYVLRKDYSIKNDHFHSFSLTALELFLLHKLVGYPTSTERSYCLTATLPYVLIGREVSLQHKLDFKFNFKMHHLFYLLFYKSLNYVSNNRTK